MNQPPNIPPGYGTPQQPAGYGPPPGNPGYPPQYQQGPGPVPHSGSYAPPPQQQQYAPPQSYPQQGFRGMTRQMFNPASYRQSGSGSWAAASLIISLVSILFCGLLSPFSLLFGLIGMVGNKRAKGMAFAGFVISLCQVGLWVAVMGLGVHQVYWAEEYATQAGAPVVAAIEEFKKDNQRVPHNIEELVANGYLPESWSTGLDDLDSAVKSSVEGKKWSEFLRYKPGSDATWEGKTGFAEVVRKGDAEDWSDFMGLPAKGDKAAKEFQTYGLAFIGVDNSWSTTDDKPVKQEAGFDLQKLFGGGDAKTREITQKRRELQKMLQSIENKSKYYETALKKAQGDLKEAEDDLRKVAKDRKLSTLEEVKGDKVANEHLLLIGEVQKRLMAVEKKSRQATDTHAQLKVKVKRLANQEEMAKLADSPAELAALDQLIADSKSALDETSGLGELDKLTERDAAEQWFKKNFR